MTVAQAAQLAELVAWVELAARAEVVDQEGALRYQSQMHQCLKHHEAPAQSRSHATQSRLTQPGQAG